MLSNVEGFRLFDISCLLEALEPLLECRSCTSGKLEMKEDTNKADKLYSCLFLTCQACSNNLQIHTSKSATEETACCRWDVNHRTEELKISLNVDEDHFVKIFNSYGVPYPISQKNYDSPEERQDLSKDQGQEEEFEEVCAADEDVVVLPETLETEKEVQETSDVSSCRNKTYKCQICGQKFKRQGELRQHSSEHSRNCSVCGKSFKKSFNLAQHMRTHTGEKPYLCPTCGKSFSDSSTLSKHLKSLHGSERPLRCQTCGKTFYHAGHLNVHMRRHTGEKPYSCEICGKSFAYCDSVKKHMLVHSDQRHFECTTCSRTFRWRESLKQHVKTHQQQKQHNSEDVQWVQQTTGAAGTSEIEGQTEPATATDVVSLTQVIPYLETIRVEYY